MLRWIAGLRTSLVTLIQRAAPFLKRRLGLVALGVSFLLLITSILSLDALFPADRMSDFQIGAVLEEDVRAPRSTTYVSEVLTERARNDAVNSVGAIYDPPDPDIARQQIGQAQQILAYVANVRFDPYGTRMQKVDDLHAVAAMTFDESVITHILELDDEQWRAIEIEVTTALERVLREPIRDIDLETVRDQLPMQVNVRFSSNEAAIAIALLEDLVRPNQFVNPAESEAARRAAANDTAAETRSFAQGQVVIRAGTRIDELDFEALQALGLMQPGGGLWQSLARSLMAGFIVVLGVGQYILRFHPVLRHQIPYLALLGSLFAVALLGAQIFTASDQYYFYPAAALSLLLVALAPVELAIIAGLALSLLLGILTGGSLEATALAAFGSLVGAVFLRRSERVDTYFVAGLMIALVNLVILCLFNFDALLAGGTAQLGVYVVSSLINGVFAAATALAAMYIVTLLFNLPTSLKLVELSQPNQALLQRLPREAPGTYQHSLQVANLSEQAATAIGANSQLVRVAALYHDIGKMLNPAFFIENQVEGVNPHDQLNDPYRSADIIISHVTDGERLARQYRLPVRIRDFILEHHGTSLVTYFYRQAIERAGETEPVDKDAFRYPGPRPRTRETAILMLADNCESTVRARKPTNRQQIAEIVEEIFDQRLRDGQLDDSSLTARDMKIIRAMFVEMLQAVFHPRINYPALNTQRRSPDTSEAEQFLDRPVAGQDQAHADSTPPLPTQPVLKSDEEPLAEVPPLRRTSKINPEEKPMNGSASPQPQNEHPEQ